MKGIGARIGARGSRFLSLGLVCLLVLAFTRDIWLPRGYIVFSDLDFGLTDEGYLKRIYGLFNDQFSSTNFFNLSRLAFTAPLYGIAVLFGGAVPHLLLRLIFVSVVLASAIGMFRLCEQLYRLHFGRFPHVLHYAGLVVPALFYAINPWVMFRVQHLFLLVGYAFYPMVVHYVLALFDDWRHPGPASGGAAEPPQLRTRRIRRYAGDEKAGHVPVADAGEALPEGAGLLELPEERSLSELEPEPALSRRRTYGRSGSRRYGSPASEAEGEVVPEALAPAGALSRKGKRERGRRQAAAYKHELLLCARIALLIGLGSASIHYFFYYILTIAAFAAVFLFVRLRAAVADRRLVLRDFVRKTIMLGGMTLIFVSYWFIPYLITSLQFAIEPQNVNVIDTLSMFSRYSDIKHVLYMVSYWWPMFDTSRYLDTPFWVAGGVLLGVIALAVFYRYAWHFYVRLFAWCAALTMLIALGVNTGLIRDLNVYLVTKVPLIGHIFRDPNKLIGPMACYFAVLLGFGTDKLIHFLRAAGYGRLIRAMFAVLLLGCVFFYYRPFYAIFTAHYYAGEQVPQAYADVQSHYVPGGKILWTPSMDNMVTGGVSSYAWNASSGDPDLKKASGDFHVYSSAKPTIFQNEGNLSLVTYFYAYLQELLDTGGAQHLGELLSWTGFNEVGFHQDVAGQQERQAFNRQVLEAQPDLTPTYGNDVIQLYRTADTAPDLTAASRALYMSKGLDGLMGVLDYKEELQLDPKHTALFWAPGRIQQPALAAQDLVVGDRETDLLFPLLDSSYFTFPFDHLDTGNPYLGWAKTLMKTPDWQWLLKSNNLKDVSWSYDYGHGIAYTSSSYKMDTPPHKMADLKGRELVGMDDVLNGFFAVDESASLQLSYMPGAAEEKPTLAGTVSPGASASTLWQTAKSRLIELDPGQMPRFLRMHAVVSGVHAGSMHFKIRFFDEERKELNVSYLSGDNDTVQFAKSEMYSDTVVPAGTRYLRVDILNSQAVGREVYFWIHDFSLLDISETAKPNALELSLAGREPGRYRTFVRLFESAAGGTLAVTAKDRTERIATRSADNRLAWRDLGTLELDGGLTIVSLGGVNAVNAVLTIREDEFEATMAAARERLAGAQADISLVAEDYRLETSLDLRATRNFRTFPNTVGGSFVPVGAGVLRKQLDLLHGGNYRFEVTGYIPPGADVDVVFHPLAGGADVRMPIRDAERSALNRSMAGRYNEVKYEEDRYYLRTREQNGEGWEPSRYRLPRVSLAQGSYELRLEIRSNVLNVSDNESLHPLAEGEITVPARLVSEEERLVGYTLAKGALSITRDKAAEGVRYRNQPTDSSQWFALGLGRMQVRKGELLAFRADVQADRLRNLHAKAMFTTSGGELMESDYMQLNEAGDQFELIAESPVDGYAQMVFLYNGDLEQAGAFELLRSEAYVLDRLVKLEMTALLPAELPRPPADPQVTGGADGYQVSNGRFLIYNEAFSPIWRQSGSGEAPLSVNLLHNAFAIEGGSAEGEIRLNPMIALTYRLFLAISLAAHIATIGLYLQGRIAGVPRKPKRRSRVAGGPRPDRPINPPSIG